MASDKALDEGLLVYTCITIPTSELIPSSQHPQNNRVPTPTVATAMRKRQAAYSKQAIGRLRLAATTSVKNWNSGSQ